MNLVYGISRWTNPSRAAARHIDNGKGKPLCGGAGRKAFTWEEERGNPTCKRCIAIYKDMARYLNYRGKRHKVHKVYTDKKDAVAYMRKMHKAGVDLKVLAVKVIRIKTGPDKGKYAVCGHMY